MAIHYCRLPGGNDVGSIGPARTAASGHLADRPGGPDECRPRRIAGDVHRQHGPGFNGAGATGS